MTLKRMFLVLMVVLLGSSATTTIASLRSLSQLHQTLDRVMNEDMKRLLVVTDVRRLFRAMTVLEREQILEKDVGRQAEQVASMRKLREQWIEKASAYEALMPEVDRAGMTSLEQAFGRWIDLDDRVLALSSASRQSEAYALARRHSEDPVSWEEVIARLVSANEVRLHSQVDASTATYQSGRAVLLVAALVATLFALVTGTAVVRGIQRMLTDLLSLNANLESLVESRTRQLRKREEAMRLMFDNVSDGLFTVDMSGRVSDERSAAASRWFGDPEGAILLWDYVGRLDASVAPSIKLGFEQVVEQVLPVEVAIGQMPSHLESGKSLFSVEYRPLRSGERFDGLLAIVRDITKQVESEKAEAEQRELTRMVQRIVRDKTGFLDFLAESQEMVMRLVAGNADPEEALRLVHTLKGNCAVFGILSVSDLCDCIEARCAEQARSVVPSDASELGRMWDGVTARVRELVVGSSSRAIEIDDAEYGSIVQSILRGAPRRTLLEHIVAWRLELTRVRLGRLADQATHIAKRLRKAPLVVSVEDNGLRLPAPRWQRFWSVAIHVLRNAIDHGIESPDERSKLGKGPARLLLSTRLEEMYVIFECADDGRGIDWEKIAARGRALGLPASTHDERVALMMRDGVTTRDEATSTSGRGVGLAAVRDACEKLGGHVRVESESGRGTSVQFWFPESTMVDESAEDILEQPITNSLGPDPILKFLRSNVPPRIVMPSRSAK